MHVYEHGVRSRGSRSWKNITTTIKELVVAYGLGFDIENTVVDVQVLWVEVLRNYYEHVDNNAAEKT
jgi:hypothetical protein